MADSNPGQDETELFDEQGNLDELEQGNNLRSANGRKMFGSFLIVAGGFLLLFVGLLFCYIGLLAGMAPEAFRISTKPPDEFQKELAANPSLFFPKNVLQLFCILGVLISSLTGFLVTHLARFSRMSHGGILALVTFVTLLQMALAKPAAPQWFIMSCLLIFPLAIIFGSYLRTRCCA